MRRAGAIAPPPNPLSLLPPQSSSVGSNHDAAPAGHKCTAAKVSGWFAGRYHPRRFVGATAIYRGGLSPTSTNSRPSPRGRCSRLCASSWQRQVLDSNLPPLVQADASSGLRELGSLAWASSCRSHQLHPGGLRCLAAPDKFPERRRRRAPVRHMQRSGGCATRSLPAPEKAPGDRNCYCHLFFLWQHRSLGSHHTAL